MCICGAERDGVGRYQYGVFRKDRKLMATWNFW